MAVLTVLSLSDAQELGRMYGLQVQGVRGILQGSVNSNYELTTNSTRFFLRIYEEQTLESARAEAELLLCLASVGVPTPKPLSRIDNPTHFISEFDRKPVALFPWVDGEPICQRMVRSEHLRHVGLALARVHAAGDNFQIATKSRFGPPQLKERMDRLSSEKLPSDVQRVLPLLRDRLDVLTAFHQSTGSLIHGDLFRDNVLWSHGQVSALLDFESASQGSRAFDIAVTLLAWCYGDALAQDLVRAFRDGYCSGRTLEPEEAESLDTQARLAALRFTITRITDFELRAKGSGVYKDFRRFIARYDALEQLGPTGLPNLWLSR